MQWGNIERGGTNPKAHITNRTIHIGQLLIAPNVGEMRHFEKIVISIDCKEANMYEFFAGNSGTFLSVEEYERDYENQFAANNGHDSWKLERQQEFNEPGNPSWEAFARGDWDDAIRLIKLNQPNYKEITEGAAARNIIFYRVRIVEEPLTPYLYWELQALKSQAECGEKIRIVTSQQIASLEQTNPLPEILTVGKETVYQIQYDHNKALSGAMLFKNAKSNEQCVETIKQIYDRGIEIKQYFQKLGEQFERQKKRGFFSPSRASQ